MPPPSLDELQSFAGRVAPGRHDADSARALARSLDEYRSRVRPRLADLSLVVNGIPFPSFFAAIDDPRAIFDSSEILFSGGAHAGASWDYLPPTSRIVFSPDGSAQLHSPDPSALPRRAIARFLLRENYVPRPVDQSLATEVAPPVGPRMALATIADSATYVRQRGVVPFAAALLLYLSEERVRFDLDLVDGALRPDPRAGRLPMDRKVRRPSRLAFAVDGYVARGDLSTESAHALEVLFETHGLTAVELAQVLGGVPEIVASALQSLTARRLATYDRRTGVYRPRLETFLSPAERARIPAEALPPMPNPALRSSVAELIAAADSRATCPLCGDPLAPGHRGILCAKCEAEVIASESPGAG
ncbi:MAG: hypothetical protein L3K09_02165 [Thermoplasmata archaeon]|nr:hypothetical protein [Thermoplasmata archaeon]